MAHTDHPDGVRAVLITTSKIELPIDIKTCTATLKVDITAQTVGKIAISIAAADITGNIPISIAAKTMGNIGIDIQAATAKVAITLNIADITGNIPIDIKAQTIGNIGIDIAAATAKVAITLNIADITGNIPIDIKAQTVGNIGISINAGDVTGNIAIDIKAATVGNLTISINAQTVGVYLKPDWESKAGHHRMLSNVGADKARGEIVSISYTVPEGKTLYVYAFSGYSYATMDGDGNTNQICAGILNVAGGTSHRIGGNGGFVSHFPAPFKAIEDQVVGVSIVNCANHSTDMGVSLVCHEE